MTGIYRGDSSDSRCHCSADPGADDFTYRRLYVALVDDWGLQRRHDSRFHCGVPAETVCIVSRPLRSKSLFTVKLGTIFIYTVLTFPDGLSPLSTHHNMAEIPSIPSVAPDAPKTSASVPLLTAAALRCLPSAPLRHSPLRHALSHSAPASVIETMTQFDEGDEPQHASDAGLFSKYILPSSFSVLPVYVWPSGQGFSHLL